MAPIYRPFQEFREIAICHDRHARGKIPRSEGRVFHNPKSRALLSTMVTGTWDRKKEIAAGELQNCRLDNKELNHRYA